MSVLQLQAVQVKANINNASHQKALVGDAQKLFGRSFLEQVAQVVSGTASAQQQKMQSRKDKYSNEKKFRDDEDERNDLMGKMRGLERRLVLGPDPDLI